MKRMIYPQFPQGKKKCFTMSYDDGHDADIRMVEKMRSCGVRGTFNLNSGQMPAEPQTYEKWGHMTMEQCVALYGDDMEIAVHGAMHPRWTEQTTYEAMLDILDDRRALERATGKIIRGASYPFGKYNDDIVEHGAQVRAIATRSRESGLQRFGREDCRSHLHGTWGVGYGSISQSLPVGFADGDRGKELHY